jgi:hypothetical protein
MRLTAADCLFGGEPWLIASSGARRERPAAAGVGVGRVELRLSGRGSVADAERLGR